MKTLKSILTLSLIVCSLYANVLQAQTEEMNNPTDEEKPTLTSLKDYNKYVKTLDFDTLTEEEKKWLTDQYNEIIKKLEAKHHTPQKAEPVQPVGQVMSYSCVDLGHS